MEKQQKAAVLECAVCLQSCIHPAQLPCGHIFCFLCVKGVANQSKKCAMCRQEIPCDFLDNPKLVHLTQDNQSVEESPEDGFQWFYEGRNGWWRYDIRTNQELDIAFQSGVRMCELLIAGFLYIIDFDSMLQLRRNDPSRRRRIKRDTVGIPVKGIAGIKCIVEVEEPRVKTPELNTSLEVTDNYGPEDAADAPQSLADTHTTDDLLTDTIEQINSLSLQDSTVIVTENNDGI